MKIKKYLIITVVVICLLVVCLAEYFIFLQIFASYQDDKKTTISGIKAPSDIKNAKDQSFWQPEILTDEYYWKKELPYPNIAESTIPDILKAANRAISAKIGNDFFLKYIKYYPSQSRISNSGDIYYLSYLVTIPEKDINFKSTTHPVQIELTINKDLSLVKPDQITSLPDCSKVNNCLDNIDREMAINTTIADMDKAGYRNPEIILDWDIYSMTWLIRYTLPNDRMTNCQFKMGGNVSIDYSSFTNKILHRQEDCSFPGV